MLALVYRSQRAVGVLIVVTVALGVVTALFEQVTSSSPATFTVVQQPVQMAMSVTLPFTGVVLAHQLRRSAPAASSRDLLGVLTAACAIALLTAVVGIVIAATATTIVSPEPSRWSDAGPASWGAITTQLLAQLVGTAAGLLIRRPVIAAAATIVIPLGCALALSALPVTANLVGWLVPTGSATSLLLAQPGAWMQWLTVLTLWALIPNAIGAAVYRQHR